MPRRNRVIPFGEIIAIPQRGTFKGMGWLNALPTTDTHRKRLHRQKPVKVPNRFKPVARIKPTVRHVSEIVPQNIIPKLKRTPPRQRLY